MPDADIAIIGAGPVGLCLANLLGQLGRSVIVLEREAEGYALPRAVTFDDEIMRIFQGLDLHEEFLPITQLGGDAEFVGPDEEVLVRWDRPTKITANGWFPNYRFHQPQLEAVLRQGLVRFPATEIRWQSEVTALREQTSQVDITLAGGGKLSASYVVGCDGGRSFTRGHIGGGSEDLGFHEEWVIIDLLLNELETEPDNRTIHYCGTPRMGSKVYVGPARKRWEFRLNPDDDAAALANPENAWPILSDWITPDEARIERTAVYTFHSLIAHNWRKGRVFIAGDAAHQTPPFMGQGMCAGLRDASNLAWKLDFALKGQGPDRLLDTYESERKPHVRQFIELTMELGRVINATAKSGKGHAMRTIKPALGPGLVAGNGAGRGMHFPQISLADQGRLDEVIGPRPALLCAKAQGEDIRRGFEDAGCAVLSDPAFPEQPTLIRPDRVVLGTHAKAEVLLPENWTVQ